MTSPTTGRAERVPNSLRPGLREATNALRIANTPSRQRTDPPPAPDGEGHDSEGHDHEACAVAELGQLLDALSETVAALAETSRSPRRAHLRGLQTALTDAGAQATALSLGAEALRSDRANPR